MPDLDLDPGLNSFVYLGMQSGFSIVLATERQCWHYGGISKTERFHKWCKHKASLGVASFQRHTSAITLVEDPIVWCHQP